MKHAAAEFPTLPDLSVVQWLGGGGFADVYLCDQQSLGRQVAVKVLRDSVTSPPIKALFDAETSLMARLSEHPHIVSIYYAHVADGGRACLVMEYCPGTTLDARYRAERLSVADVLAIGIHIGGAVETAHRAGILHRDIKPANILTTRYGKPALTDFGISVAKGHKVGTEASGVSVPWSPPEMLDGDFEGDVRSDVYSLAATLYTLLERRSPYQIIGGANGWTAMLHRIENTPLPRIARTDVPYPLERALARGLAKRADDRWSSILEMVRVLQDIQSDLGQPITAVEVLEENPVAVAGEPAQVDDGRTRVRRLTTIRAQEPQLTAVTSIDHTQVRGGVLRDVAWQAAPQLAPPPIADTLIRPPASAPEPDQQPPVASSHRWVIMAAAALALIVGGLVVTVLALRGTTVTPVGEPTPSAHRGRPVSGIDVGVPKPDQLRVAVAGDKAVFTWRNPDPQDGDTFQWRRTDRGSRDATQNTDQATATVDSAKACIEIRLVRNNGTSSDPADLCAAEG